MKARISTCQAEQDGRDAFLAGKPVSANPFSIFNGRLFEAWLLGWTLARDERRKAA